LKKSLVDGQLQIGLSAFDVRHARVPFKGNFKSDRATKMMADNCRYSSQLVYGYHQIAMSAIVDLACEPFKVGNGIEDTVRTTPQGNISWESSALWGWPWPHGMSENDKFPSAIITLPQGLKWATG